MKPIFLPIVYIFAFFLTTYPAASVIADTECTKIRRKVFYTTTDFGHLSWLYKAKGEHDTRRQSWVSKLNEGDTNCFPIRNQYWLQINHKDDARDGQQDAFAVVILYFKDFQTETPIELQLYRNKNWFSIGNSKTLPIFRKEQDDLVNISANDFIKLNSGLKDNDILRLQNLNEKLGGEFHAKIERARNSLSSWNIRVEFSEWVKKRNRPTLFRYAGRLYRYEVTSKPNSNDGVIVEMNRHNASEALILIQSLSEEVRDGLRGWKVKFKQRCN